VYYPAEFGRSRSNGTSIINEIRLKIWPIASRLSKVVETNTDRSAIYDFLLTFHSNHGPISYRVRDKRRLQSKITNFPTPVHLTPPLKGFPLQLVISAWSQKTRILGLPGLERSFTISLDVWIEYKNVTDERTDRRAEIGRQSWRLYRKIKRRQRRPHNVARLKSPSPWVLYYIYYRNSTLLRPYNSFSKEEEKKKKHLFFAISTKQNEWQSTIHTVQKATGKA